MIKAPCRLLCVTELSRVEPISLLVEAATSRRRPSYLRISYVRGFGPDRRHGPVSDPRLMRATSVSVVTLGRNSATSVTRHTSFGTSSPVP